MSAINEFNDLKIKIEKALVAIHGLDGREIRTITSTDNVEQVEIVCHGDVLAVSVWDLKPSLISKHTRILRAYYYDDVSSKCNIETAVAHYKKQLHKLARIRHYERLSANSKTTAEQVSA
jgi:hypothetical protein